MLSVEAFAANSVGGVRQLLQLVRMSAARREPRPPFA
jgi:hypothetical protein